MAFAVPAWAVDLKLGGKYEIQGRYYHEKDIRSLKVDDNTPITTTYFKHYFNLYPTLVVTDKISVKADLEVFDNVISHDDSRQFYDKSSPAVPYSHSTGDVANLDPYDLFTVNELYVDAITAVGMFRAGKTRDFNGIGWFIQVPAVPDWTFGLVWNKKDEGGNKYSYLGYDSSTGLDGSDPAGAITNHGLADIDEFALIANYAKDAIDFKGTLAYKHSDKDREKTSIWFPYVYFNYAITKDLKFNSKLAFATGTLLDKDSKVAKAAVAEAVDAIMNEVSAGVNAYADGYAGAEPTPLDSSYTVPGGPTLPITTLAEYRTAHGAWVAVRAAAYAGALAAAMADLPELPAGGGFEKDWKVDNAYGFWIGLGYTLDALKIQGDVAYMPGADEPQNVSAYLEDTENLDTWLMNDVSDLYSYLLETPATIAALGDPRWDDNYSYANAILARLNFAYKFTDKLDGNLNLVWGEKENVKYLENWDYTNPANGLVPTLTKVGGDLGPDKKFKVDKGLGWEARARVNYALQDNLSVGLDLCYYAPGDYYKSFIEKGFTTTKDPDVKLENTYAARWKATVKF
jgi:hypothetical protein